MRWIICATLMLVFVADSHAAYKFRSADRTTERVRIVAGVVTVSRVHVVVESESGTSGVLSTITGDRGKWKEIKRHIRVVN